MLTPVGVEIVILTKFAKIKLRQEALQSIFSGRLDIFYPPNFGSLRRKSSFNSHGCFQQLFNYRAASGSYCDTICGPKFWTLCQPIPGAATSAVHYQVAFFQKLAEVLLERVPTRAGQCNYIADGDASVFTRILEDVHGQFGYGR